MTAGRRYGYFAIQRVHGGIATMPDGEKQTFESFEDAMEARTAWITENALPEATRKAAEERQEFIDECKIEQERIKQPGLLSPDLVEKKVVDPSGEYLGDPTKREFAEIVEQAAEKRFPEPHAPGLFNELEGGVEKTVVWAASLYLNGQPQRLPAFSWWDYGLPIENVLEVLNELAADGWHVVHVSEDRGIYSGATNQTDSAVTRARYLLAREA